MHRLNGPQRSDHIRHRRHEGAEDVGRDTHEKAVHQSALVAAVILHSTLNIEGSSGGNAFTQAKKIDLLVKLAFLQVCCTYSHILASKRKSSLNSELFIDAIAICVVATTAVHTTGVAWAEVVDAVGTAHRVVFVIGALASGVATRV